MLACNGHSFLLFTININLREAIFNKFFSLLNVSTYVIELLSIVEIGQDLIPRSSLDSLLWKFCIVKDLNCIWIIRFETKVAMHVLIFQNKLISL